MSISDVRFLHPRLPPPLVSELHLRITQNGGPAVAAVPAYRAALFRYQFQDIAPPAPGQRPSHYLCFHPTLFPLPQRPAAAAAAWCNPTTTETFCPQEKVTPETQHLAESTIANKPSRPMSPPFGPSSSSSIPYRPVREL
ncbi:hypothetical protein CCHR01_19889 [Colletotrichum chrysophilum]|uniref:Uncharacterized protein n=1 Tax=Colletotrichum chrysophilum TaxID=1836956 RepID=A0AAD8ZYW5_9PEZI|nr:hypothetical protein CCHR01_19889 [Colletotrichum chrysophilum]